jgi:predicted GTPase
VIGSGKSTFINLISGSTLGVSDSMESCTSTVQASIPFELGGQTVTLIDTPGFDDTNRSDADVLKMIAMFLKLT